MLWHMQQNRSLPACLLRAHQWKDEKLCLPSCSQALVWSHPRALKLRACQLTPPCASVLQAGLTYHSIHCHRMIEGWCTTPLYLWTRTLYFAYCAKSSMHPMPSRNLPVWLVMRPSCTPSMASLSLATCAHNQYSVRHCYSLQ